MSTEEERIASKSIAAKSSWGRVNDHVYREDKNIHEAKSELVEAN
jgi:hypothetical protein